MTTSTSFGDIQVNQIGSGKKILFFHGGPGMSHTYLKPSFANLTEFERIYFDQLGCGESSGQKIVNEENTVLSTGEVINNLGIEKTDYFLILHSWGAYLFGALLEKKLLNKLPKKVILLNPTPFNKKDFDLIGGDLVKRVPTDVISKIVELSNEGSDESGAELMKLAQPYYNGHANEISNLGKIEYRISTYNRVSQSIPEFDHKEIFSKICDKLFFVFGETDYISETFFIDFLNSENHLVLKGGHFSFAENNDFMETIINNVFQ